MPRETEREFEISEEKEINIKKLMISGEILAERTRKEGVPVTKDSRIDMDGFKDTYTKKDLDKDKEKVKNQESKWFPGMTQEQISKEELK